MITWTPSPAPRCSGRSGPISRSAKGLETATRDPRSRRQEIGKGFRNKISSEQGKTLQQRHLEAALGHIRVSMGDTFGGQEVQLAFRTCLPRAKYSGGESIPGEALWSMRGLDLTAF